MPSSRIIEMVEAEAARLNLGKNYVITPDAPPLLRATILVAMQVDLNMLRLDGQLSPEGYGCLCDDLSFVIQAFVGKDFALSPIMEQARKAYARDLVDSMLNALHGRHNPQ